MEVLSQDDINQLLDAINAEDTTLKDFKSAHAERKIKIYDFKRPDKFSKEQIRTITVIHETFARLTTKSLSARLRSMFHVHVVSVDQLTYEEFIRCIPTPTTLGIISMAPLKGNAALEIAPAITFSIIDRICGGTGELPSYQHELTDTEKNIMEDIIFRMLENLKKAWTGVMDIQPVLSRIETNPQFSQFAPPTDMTVLVSLEAKLSDVEGMISICIPFSTVEPIMEKFSTYQQAGKIDIDSSKKVDEEDIPVKLSAEILRRDYSIKEISEWGIGTELLPLSPLAPNRCYCWFGDRNVWQCEILPDKKRYAKSVKIIGVTDKLFAMEEDKMEESKVNTIVEDALSNVRVRVSAEIGSTLRTIKEVRGMGEGTVLELDRMAGEPADVKANGVLIARGEVVVIDEKFGVYITEIVAPAASSQQGADEPSPAQAG